MIKNISLALLYSFVLSCTGQESKLQLQNIKEINSLKDKPCNITDAGDGTKSNYDDLSPEFINKAKKVLEQRKFQFPDENTFNQKILDVFSFNLKDYKNSIIALRPAMFPEVAIKENKFIFIQDAGAAEPEFMNPDLLYHFNSYIFYNTPVSYVWLQTNNSSLLYDLVVYYGYNKDKKLVESVFKKFDFNSLSDMEQLIFIDSGGYKKLKKQIFDDIETIIYKGKVEDFSYAKEGDGYLRIGDIISKISSSPKEYFEPEKTISYLFERELRVGIQGDIESYLNKNPTYKSNMEKNKFYDLPTLKDYVKYIYQKESNTNFIIQDSDGFTNLRKEKNSSSQILQKINTGEQVEVLDRNGDWWLVVSKEGKKGYVHKSRIKSE
ncbi:SH3 domain-containing protein [Chryseobacterium sp. EZn1]|uniref:SH3 domain-containing protein n=1 Tax=Chryseobacterium cupriresistens TaxID=3366770 RepID=UPI003984D33D